MALPPMMPPYDVTRVRFKREDSTDRPDLRHGEPGTLWNNRYSDTCSVCFPEVTQIVDLALTGGPVGVDSSFTLTLDVLKTQTGNAGSDGLGPVTLEIPVLAGTTLVDSVTAIIDAAEDAGSLLTPDDLITWNQLIRYVQLSVSPTAPPGTVLRLEALHSGSTFAVSLSPADSVVVTPTTISEPSEDATIPVGFYVALDTDRGANGYNNQGQAYIKRVEASTPEDEILGPIALGADTLPVEGGFPYKEYASGSDMPSVLFGYWLVYAEQAVPASAIKSPVYVRHTDAGDFEAGMAATQATAEAGATAAVVTSTPVAANDTLYEYTVELGGKLLGTVRVLSGPAATADEIAASQRQQLAAFSEVTQDAATGSPVVLTGPADGRALVLTPTAANVGDNGIVATTPGVSTHTKLETRGDTFEAQSLRIGSAPIRVPQSNA